MHKGVNIWKCDGCGVSTECVMPLNNACDKPQQCIYAGDFGISNVEWQLGAIQDLFDYLEDGNE